MLICVCSEVARWCNYDLHNQCRAMYPLNATVLSNPNKKNPRTAFRSLCLWWSLEWDRRPTTTRPESGAGLAVVARADWLQGHATETAKMRQREEAARTLSVSIEMHEKREI